MGSKIDAVFSSLTPAAHPTLRDHAYAQIRGALMAGRFEPGQKMTIRGLASALGISPTPIREAVRRLAGEGAVEIIPSRRMRVPLLSPQRLRDIRDVRAHLEGLATERAVPNLTDQQIQRLTRIHEEMQALRGKADWKGMVRRNHEFHFTIYRAAAMPDLLQIVESLWLRTGPYVNLLFPDYSIRDGGITRGKILQQVQRRDAASARAALEQDITKAVSQMAALVEQRTGGQAVPIPPSRRRAARGRAAA